MSVKSLGNQLVTQVCPIAPPGAQVHVDQVQGYVMWGVIIMMGVAALVGIGAVVGGRMFAMTHASKVGVISVVVVMISAIALLIVPGMLQAILGDGCV
ncbi:hypothetical protein [Aeromicrobium alkaliterrae]|uniref:Integral membrane protein n=1 Tax=Aeromicrobium alkaliterrae TaxID=302168 RepID=A0ABP4WF01_9ACTN